MADNKGTMEAIIFFLIVFPIAWLIIFMIKLIFQFLFKEAGRHDKIWPMGLTTILALLIADIIVLELQITKIHYADYAVHGGLNPLNN